MIILFSSVSLLSINAAFSLTDTIYNGITIGNVPVGGLSVNEAKTALRIAFEEQKAHSTIRIKHQENTWSITPEEIELTINVDELAEQAYHIGRSGSIIKILQERYLTANGGYVLPLMQQYNHDKLYNIITAIAQSIDKDPRNASVVYKNNAIEIIPEILGQKVDTASALADISRELAANMEFTYPLIVNSQHPTIVAQDLVDIDDRLAVYTTEFDPSKKNRYQNVEIASKQINNRLVRPGEVFSFNQNVGLRLPEYGYKEAPVFVDGKLTLDWGGGVCQVSTTLYNAVLLADMDIEERTSHFQPPPYVPLGQDAAVADNLLDFKFKNTSSHNIYVKSEVSNHQITVSIFGKNISNPPEIRIETDWKALEYNTIVKQDNSLPLGKEIVESPGQKGFAVTTYRVKLVNGKESSREKLSFDEFSPEDRIIRVGTKSEPPKASK